MKRLLIFRTLMFLLIASLLSFDSFTTSKPPHNGTVMKAGDYIIEIKNDYPIFYVYLLDHNLKPISNTGLSCQSRFYFPNQSSMNLRLNAFNEDGFSTPLTTVKYNLCRIRIGVYGKIVSAMFENEGAAISGKNIR